MPRVLYQELNGCFFSENCDQKSMLSQTQLTWNKKVRNEKTGPFIFFFSRYIARFDLVILSSWVLGYSHTNLCTTFCFFSFI